jgi:hypothetical protein
MKSAPQAKQRATVKVDLTKNMNQEPAVSVVKIPIVTRVERFADHVLNN